MNNYLCFTVRFLQPLSHGRGGGGEPEWPPSPLRVFQALVAASAARWNERVRLSHTAPALRWLEHQQTPSIVAATGVASQAKYRLYVPDNVADKVAASWSRGNTSSIADYRTEKDIHPMRLDCEVVHYLFPLTNGDAEFEKHRETLTAAARSITHLGWGIDMVVANATVISDEEASRLSGERWKPVEADGRTAILRVPIAGTLDDLIQRHTAFLSRLTPDGFAPVPPLSAFRVVGYRRSFDPAPRPFAAFSILKLDGSGYSPFDTARRSTVVAGMVRHALASAAKKQRPFGWSDDDISGIVLGHEPGPDRGQARVDPGAPRFAYLPLPSIERRGNQGNHVGMIRRVIIAGRPGMAEQIAWVRRALSGAELIDERSGEAKALLSLMPTSDWVAQQYWERSSTWTTVTPIVIPGYDDRKEIKTEKLLRKALIQAGFAVELVQHAELDWRGIGFLPGVDLASRYRRPRNIQEAPVRHLKIRWRDSKGNPLMVPGPIAIGSGRFRGLGLFASLESADAQR